MAYDDLGLMKTKSGHRDDVVSILLGGADHLRAAGCDLYIVSLSDHRRRHIWFSELWQSKEHHDASLPLPETKAAVSKATPMLTGEFTSQEVTVVGGLGR